MFSFAEDENACKDGLRLSMRVEFASQDQIFLDPPVISEVSSEYLDTHIIAGLCNNLVK